MSDQRAQELIDLGNKLFAQKEPLNGLMQEIALQFFPVRATFTRSGDYLGRDYSAHLNDSYPVLVRRELGDSLSATLRPRDQKWFAATTLNEDRDADPVNARFLEHITTTMRSAIYDTRAKFVRSTKEGDHDFITFGQTVLSIEEAPLRTHLYYRTHHIRDCAWLENEIGEIDHLHRKDQFTARAMMRKFKPKTLHQSVKDAAEKEPGKLCNIRCVMMPSDEYDYTGGNAKKGGKKLPYILVYIDADNAKMLLEVPSPDFLYVVPRWQTLPGLQYAVSPATSIALPDGRLSQAMALMIMEAGEKSIDPPMVANADVIREANIAAGAITWADLDGDQKLSEAFQMLNINADMRTAFAMRSDLRDMLAKAFFIDKLALPEATDKMTATEIRARLEEHVRNLLPLFEPMEHEYNGRILDKTFNRLMAMQRFRMDLMPPDLNGADIAWGFKNPLQEASTRILASQYQEAIQIEMAGQQVGVDVPRVDFATARDDAVRGIGVPAKWRRTEDDMAAEAQARAQRAQLAAAAQQAGAVADLGKKAGDAAQSLQAGGVTQPPGADQAANDDDLTMPEIPDDLGDDEAAVA